MLREIDYIQPHQLYAMIQNEPFSFILESSLYHQDYGRYSIVSASPFEVIESKNEAKGIQYLRQRMQPYRRFYEDELPFHGGAVGYISYDAGRMFEKIKVLSSDEMQISDIYFGLYDWAFVTDHKLKKNYIVTADIDPEKEKRILLQRHQQASNFVQEKIPSIPRSEENLVVSSNFTKQQYMEAVEKIRRYIENGDIYQANFTQCFETKTKREASEIYAELRTYSPTFFGGLLNFEKVQIISNSPERFMKVKDQKVETRPIKGTRPRGKTEKEDQILREELLGSSKDRAELLMIVDLERNDLGRVSKVGSVKVPELFVIEEYKNVHHLVATITSEMDEGKDVYDLIRAAFPGGSITGAPKIRAMEIIEELEPTSRNVYTGSIGYIGFDENIDLNIAIRTMVKKEEKITFQAGGGITWDSKAEEEYLESLHKADAIMKVLKGRLKDDL